MFQGPRRFAASFLAQDGQLEDCASDTREEVKGEGLPPGIAELIGVESDPVLSPDEVCRPMIRHWCEMVEDTNPLYTDDEYARSSEYGEVISPSVMARTWTMLPWWTPPAARAEPFNPLTRVVELLNSQSQVQVEIGEEYFLPIRLGDRMNCTTTVLDVSPLKSTRMGQGHFVTYLLKYGNQRSELVGTLRATLLVLRQSSGDEAA